ncbi:MAG: GNAT family N-acetyltransferase [Prolixibacteraceae bacterium]|nr:GNAT family N-acetyltransferase [Prolixibacteraceae bacterium]
MTEYIIYETERLLLRPTSIGDAEFILELFNTPDWLKYIGNRNVLSVESAREYIKCKMLPQMEQLGFGNYTVIRKSDQVSMGICGLYDREGLEGLDIGFAFLPEYRGNGYAFESANKLKQVVFHDFGITEIVAITTKDNMASQKLLEKLGLTFTGTTKIPNDDEELLLYKICK